MMAKESDYFPVSPQRIKGDEQDSTDNPSGKPRAAHKRNEAVPHYLRASTSSCHDSCKYGKPHEFKDKPKRPLRRRISAPPPNGENTVEIQIFVDKKVKNAIQQENIKRSPTRVSAPAIDKIKKTSPPPRKSLVRDSSKLLKPEVRSSTKSSTPEGPKVTKKAVRYPGKSSLPDTSKVNKREVIPTAKKDVPSKRASSDVKDFNISTPLKPNGATVKPSSSSDFFRGSGGKQTSKTTTVDNPRTSRVAVKKVLTPPTAASTLKRVPKVEVKKILDSSAPVLSRPISGVKVVSSQVRKIKNPKDQSQKSQACDANQLSTNKTMLSRSVPRVKVVSSSVRKTKSSKDQSQRSQAAAQSQISINTAKPKESVEENMEEKTLHMIDTRENCLCADQSGSQFILSPSPLSPESLNSSTQTNSHPFTSDEVDSQGELGSEYTDSEADDSVSGSHSSGNEEEVDSLKEDRRKINNGGTLDPRNQDPESMKLKFRRGKVVELKSETNSPRRLRFRQGRILEDNQRVNGGPRRKSYRRRAAVSDNKESETGPVKVVLKHQDVETKKDEQVLLNNVIEQTANKLVETRKSKVKALVGAFETVISLQERKPSAANR